MAVWKKILTTVLLVLSIEKSHACTGIVQKMENGDHVFARTMEFGQDFLSFDLLFVPRGIDYTSQTNQSDERGTKWKTHYAFIGFNPLGLPLVLDGINERGLACGGFYFPGWAEYEQVSQEKPIAISNIDFVTWVLGNFATVGEVRQALQRVSVVGVVYKPWGIIPGMHYIVVDEKGDRAVIEYVKGQLNLYDAAIGTITNAPTYDWHEINARNYIGLSTLNRPAIKINGQELASFGQGSGAIGLPGDFSPPSRFIRATFLNQVVLPAKDGLGGIQRAFKILNQFDIPKGAIKEKVNGETKYEVTQWTSASDLTGRRYFYHTSESRLLRFVDLNALDLNAKALRSIPIEAAEPFIDESDKFR